MSAPAIALLSDDDFDLTVEEPEFEALAAVELGIAGSDDDGFDTVFLEAAEQLTDEPNVMAGLDSDEIGIADEVPEVQIEREAPVLVEMADAQNEGDAAIAEHEDSTTLQG